MRPVALSQIAAWVEGRHLGADVSVEAVESLLARARRGLKAVLADRWEELLDDMGSL